MVAWKSATLFGLLQTLAVVSALPAPQEAGGIWYQCVSATEYKQATSKEGLAAAVPQKAAEGAPCVAAVGVPTQENPFIPSAQGTAVASATLVKSGTGASATAGGSSTTPLPVASAGNTVKPMTTTTAVNGSASAVLPKASDGVTPMVKTATQGKRRIGYYDAFDWARAANPNAKIEELQLEPAEEFKDLTHVILGELWLSRNR
jgi:hypothetical protein